MKVYVIPFIKIKNYEKFTIKNEILKKVKKYCSNCNKEFSNNNDYNYCPICTTTLKEDTVTISNIEFIPNIDLIYHQHLEFTNNRKDLEIYCYSEIKNNDVTDIIKYQSQLKDKLIPYFNKPKFKKICKFLDKHKVKYTKEYRISFDEVI